MLRLKKKIGLVELGRHTGSVAGAALEDRTRPVVPDAAHAAAHRARLQRRARVLLCRRPRKAAHRDRAEKAQRVRLPERSGVKPAYRFESLDYPATERPFNSYYAEFLPLSDAMRPHAHPGVELIYALAGDAHRARRR